MDPVVHPSATYRSRGFTLVELLAVLAIISLMVTVVLRTDMLNRRTADLRSAQVALANVISLARVRASNSGRTARVLVNVDASGVDGTQRFLRYVIAQVSGPSGWETVTAFRLPAGVFILPGNFSAVPEGLWYPTASAWVRADGFTPLRSTALRAAMVANEMVDEIGAEDWVSVSFSSVGTTAQSGDLVLARGEMRAPGTYAIGQSPVELRTPDDVCGLTLSSYGVSALIENRQSF